MFVIVSQNVMSFSNVRLGFLSVVFETWKSMLGQAGSQGIQGMCDVV